MPDFFEFRALSQWPVTTERTVATDRRRSRFESSLDNTVSLLDSELRMIGAQRATIEIDIEPKALRSLSVPAKGYRADDPAVVLRYVDEHGVEITMPCDTFFTWQENLRAIALTVRNLRKCEDYGAVRRGQQFRGFAALPAVTTTALSYEQAAKTALRLAGKRETAELLGKVLTNPIYARDVVRLAMNKTHPEKASSGNGSSNDFVLAQECKRVLQAKHGVDL
jgi:hypothetical protein